MVYDPRNSNIKYDPRTSYKNPRNVVMPTIQNTLPNTLPNTLNTIPNNLPSGLPTQVGSPYPYYWKSTHYQPKQYPDLVSNYNDPYALNSMADVISASFNPKMDNANIVDKGPLQVLNIIPNTLKMINDTTVKPIAQGEFGKAAINNLMAFAETADIIANPVKGYLMEGQEGFVKGLGFSDQGRTNYDWDTGNMAVDMGLELISDPLNWFTFFGSGAIKTSVKSGLKKAGMEASQELDVLVKAAARAYLDGNKKDIITNLSEAAARLGRQADDPFIQSFNSAMELLVKGSEFKTNLQIIKGTSSLVTSANKLDDAIFRAALRTTPATGAIWLSTKAIHPLYDYAYRSSLDALTAYKTPLAYMDIMQLDEIEKAFSRHKFIFNKFASRIFGVEAIDNRLLEILVKNSLSTEVDTIFKYLKELNIEKYPNILPEEKLSRLYDFLDEELGGDYQMFLDVLHDYNEKNPETYQWFEERIRETVDYDIQKAKYQEQLNKIAQFNMDTTKNFYYGERWQELYDTFNNIPEMQETLEQYKRRLDIVEAVMAEDNYVKLTEDANGQIKLDIDPDFDAIRASHLDKMYYYRAQEIQNANDALAYAEKQLEYAAQQVQYKAIREAEENLYTLKEFIDVEVKGRDITSRQAILRLNKFTQEKWGTNFNSTVDNIMKRLNGQTALTYVGGEPKSYEWFTDYIYKHVKVGPHKANAQKVQDYIKNNIFNAKSLTTKNKYEGLLEFIKDNHKGITIDEYLERLTKLNQKYEGEFDYAINSIREIQDAYKGLHYTETEAESLLKQYKKYDDIIAKVPDMKRTLDYMSGANAMLQKLFRSSALHIDVDVRTATAKQALDERVNLIMQMLEANVDIDIPEYAEIVKELFQAMDSVITKVLNLMELGRNTDEIINPWVVFDKQIKNIIDKAYETLDEVVANARAYSSHSFSKKLSDEFTNTTELFKDNYLETSKMFRDKTSQLRAEGLSTASIQDCNKLIDDVMKFFTKSGIEGLEELPLRSAISDWFQTVGKDLAMSEEGFVEAVYNFIMVPENIDEFLDAYETFSRTVNRMARQIESKSPNIGSTEVKFKENLASLMHNNWLKLDKNRDLPPDARAAQLAYFRTVVGLSEINVAERHPIHELSDILDNFSNKYKIEFDTLIDLNIDAVYYKNQLEKMYVTELLLTDPEINEVIDVFMTPGNSAYSIINNIASDPDNEGYYEAVHALEGFQHFLNYKEFREVLANLDGVRPEVKTAFLSTIQKYARADAREVAEDVESYAFSIFKETENHYNGIMMGEKLNVESLFDKYVKENPELHQKYLAELEVNGLTGQAHIAIEDNIMTKYVTMAVLEKELPDSANVIKVYFDMETSDLNRHAGNIIQFSAYVDETDKLTRDVKSDMPLKYGAIKSMTKSDETDRTSLLHVYTNTYQKDALPEAEAFLELIDYLEGKVLTGKSVKLIMHNGKLFDKPYLIEKLKRLVNEDIDNPAIKELYTRAMTVLNKVEIKDTYHIIAKQKGYMALNPFEKGALTKLLDDLASKQASFKYAGPMDRMYTPYLIQPMNSSVGKMLRELSKVMDKELKTGKLGMVRDKFGSLLGDGSADEYAFLAKMSGDFLDNANKILTFFETVSSSNRVLGLDYIDKSIFDKDTFVKNFGLEAYDKFVEDYGLNYSQALYSKYDPKTKERAFINGIRYYGYKVGIDTSSIREFFDFREASKINVYEADRYTRYARIINNYAQSVRNGSLLREYAHEINEAVYRIREALKYTDAPEYLQRLTFHDSYLYNYAILQFIYNRPEELLKAFWETAVDNNLISSRLFNILDNPKQVIRKTKYSDKAISFLEDAPSIINIKRGVLDKSVDDLRIRQRDALDEFLALNREMKEYASLQAGLERLIKQGNIEKFTLDTIRKKGLYENKVLRDNIQQQIYHNRKFKQFLEEHGYYYVGENLRADRVWKEGKQIPFERGWYSDKNVKLEIEDFENLLKIFNIKDYEVHFSTSDLYLSFENKIKFLEDKIKQLYAKNEDRAIAKLDKAEREAYKEMYTELLQLEEEALKTAQLEADFVELYTKQIEKIESVVEKHKGKIEKMQKITDVEAVSRAFEQAERDLEDKVNVLKNIAKGLDDNSAQRAYTQKKIAELNEVYGTVKEFRSLVDNANSIEAKLYLIENMETYTNRLSFFEIHQVLNMSDTDLLAHLATDAKRIITFNAGDYKNNKLFIEDIAKLYERRSDLKKLGIEIKYEDTSYLKQTENVLDLAIENATQMYIVLTKDAKVHNINGKLFINNVEFAKPIKKDYSIDDILSDMNLTPSEKEFYQVHMKKAREQVINLSEGRVFGGLGEIANQTYYKELYAWLPKDIKGMLPSITEMINNETVHAVNFNHSVLGSTFNRRKFAQYMPTDALSIYANSAVYAANYSSQISEYSQLYFNKMYSIDMGIMKDMSDEEIFAALKSSDEFTLAFLREEKGKPMPQKINLTSAKVISSARKLNAVILPTQTYNKSFEVIQNFHWSETEFNAWHKIIHMYKSGILASTGLLFRNIIDSTVKNMISTKDPIGIVKTYADGFRVYNQYKTALREIMQMDTSGKERILRENTEMYFKNMNPSMPRELYDMIHGFMEDGPAGEVKILQQAYKRQRDKNKVSSIYDKYIDATSALLAPNNEIEQIARLSEYLWAVRNGMTNTEAYRLVTKTHFDYGLKTKTDMLTELVFPFYTFKMRNLEYWVEAVNKNPWLLSLFRDVMTPIWNFDEYDENEMERNRSLQYQILSGNVPLNDNGMTLKVNPSFMDVYNTVTDPLGTVQSSLAPPFKFMLNLATQGADKDGFIAKTLGTGKDISFLGDGGYDDSIMSLLPWVGAFYQRQQNAEKYSQRLGIDLFNVPLLGGEFGTVFGATQRWTPFPQSKPRTAVKKGYTPKAYTPRGQGGKRLKARKASIYTKRTPRGSKPEKYYPQNSKVYHKNFYHKNNYNGDNIYKKLYTAKGASKLKTAMTPVTPTTLKYKLRLMHNYFR